MAFGFLSFRSRRNRREAVLSRFVEKLNALDYDGATAFLHSDLQVLNPDGTVTNGIEDFVQHDRAFRNVSARPQIVVSEILHHDNDLLVRGELLSSDPEMGGTTMWRVTFDKDRIISVETTRAENATMALRPRTMGGSI